MAVDTSFEYSHPTYRLRQTVAGVGSVGAGEETRSAYLNCKFPTRLWNVHWFTNTAGTAAASSIVLRSLSGTTTATLGTMTPGTAIASASGSLNSMTAGVTPTLLAAGARVWAQTGAADALANWDIEYEISYDAATSAVTAANQQGG